MHNPITACLAAALVFAACTFGSALAQEPPQKTVLADEIEEVVVTAKRREGSGGGRRTAASREQLDRSDQTGMDGFFDDIDGLSTLGADGEGNAFSIDGLSADLGNVTLNGQGMGEGRGSGGFSAGDLPPDMIRRVDVFKMPTAVMDGMTIAAVRSLEITVSASVAGIERQNSMLLSSRSAYRESRL